MRAWVTDRGQRDGRMNRCPPRDAPFGTGRRTSWVERSRLYTMPDVTFGVARVLMASTVLFVATASCGLVHDRADGVAQNTTISDLDDVPGSSVDPSGPAIADGAGPGPTDLPPLSTTTTPQPALPARPPESGTNARCAPVEDFNDLGDVVFEVTVGATVVHPALLDRLIASIEELRPVVSSDAGSVVESIVGRARAELGRLTSEFGDEIPLSELQLFVDAIAPNVSEMMVYLYAECPAEMSSTQLDGAERVRLGERPVD